MTYIGLSPPNTFTKSTSQTFTGNGSTTDFTLQTRVSSPEDLEVFVSKSEDGKFTLETYYPYETSDGEWDYDWCVANWGTKWDIEASSIEFEYEDEEQLEISFDTAWSPPEPICYRLREMFKDLNFSWFYNEPGMEFAGYL